MREVVSRLLSALSSPATAGRGVFQFAAEGAWDRSASGSEYDLLFSIDLADQLENQRDIR
jgi:hypothetical protein